MQKGRVATLLDIDEDPGRRRWEVPQTKVKGERRTRGRRQRDQSGEEEDVLQPAELWENYVPTRAAANRCLDKDG
jgi:hypothetical protein